MIKTWISQSWGKAQEQAGKGDFERIKGGNIRLWRSFNTRPCLHLRISLLCQTSSILSTFIPAKELNFHYLSLQLRASKLKPRSVLQDSPGVGDGHRAQLQNPLSRAPDGPSSDYAHALGPAEHGASSLVFSKYLWMHVGYFGFNEAPGKLAYDSNCTGLLGLSCLLQVHCWVSWLPSWFSQFHHSTTVFMTLPANYSQLLYCL